MPKELNPDVPEHVQRVRDMSSDDLFNEAEAIWNLPSSDPPRIVPASFRDDDDES